MNKDVQILIAEDNEGHFSLIKKIFAAPAFKMRSFISLTARKRWTFCFVKVSKRERISKSDIYCFWTFECPRSTVWKF